MGSYKELYDEMKSKYGAPNTDQSQGGNDSGSKYRKLYNEMKSKYGDPNTDQVETKEEETQNVVKGKPILESVERDDGIFSMQVPQKKAQTAPEETPAAVKPAFDRDQWLQDYAKEAERVFSPDQAYQEQKAREEYLKNQEDLRRNQEVTAKNLATLESWPEEDQQMLIQYAINDHRGRSLWDRSSTSATRAATALVELQKKYDKDTIERMAESYRWYTNEIATNTMRDEAAKEVQGKPGAAIVHSGIARLAGLAGSVTAPLDYLGQALGGTGQYSTLDPNAVGNIPNVYSSAVTQTVAKDIEGDGKSVGRKAASYLYQGGMSALDTGARLLASGGNPTIAATLAGLGTFGQTVSQASAQGATPAQAIAYGTAAAGIEALTEKLPLDELVKTAKGGWNGLKPAIKEAFKQAGIEVAEEEIGLIASTLAEMAILQEKASTNQRIQQLVAEEGMSVAEANNQVMYELLGEAMDTAVVSAISGGLSSAGGSTVAYMGRDTGGAQTAQEGAEAAQSQETAVAEVTADTAAEQQQTQAEEPQSNVQKAVQEFRDTGKVSNRMAEVILSDPQSMSVLQNDAGLELPDTASGRRNAVKDAVAQLSRNEDAKDLTSSTAEALIRNQEQPQEAKAENPEETRRLAIEATRELQGLPKQETVENVDTYLNGQYNNNIKNGGNNYAGNQGLSGIDEAGLPGGTGAGRIRGMGAEQIQGNGRASGGMETGGDLGPGSMEAGSRGGGYEVQLRVSPVLRVSDNLSTAQENRGTPTYQVKDTTGQPKIYAAALVDGRNSDPVNGWCVTPKSAQELEEGSVRTFMNDTGTVGVGVAADGDIVAVFKNKNGGPKRALDTAMPIAIEQGGDRLDCYGEGLVRAYENYGFIPVARVEFNPEYANDGWTPDKGTPYIYFMMHNGDSSAEVARKMHSYPHKTKAELEALPAYGKDDYDAAMEYRNGLIDQRSADMDHGAVGAAEAGFSKVDYELLGAGNEQRDRPNDVRTVSVNIPKKDASGKTISDFAGNLFGSALTPDAFADTVQQMAFDGNFSYDPMTNEEALTNAAKGMEGQTIDGIVGDIVAKAETGKFKTEDISKGILMYGFLADQKDSQSQKKAAEICVALSKFATASGRNLQLFSIFRRMTPEGQMMAIQQTVRTSIADLVRKGLVKKDTKVDIDQALLDEYRKAAEEVKRLEAAEGRLEDAEGRLKNAREETRTAEREAKKAERKADRAEERANQAEDEAAEILAADQERIQEAEGRLEDANKRVKDARKEAKRLKDLEKAIQRREQAEQAIYADAAAKMKVTFKNKWDTWRYMAMLGNVKTQARNFGGNIAYMPHTELKRLIGTILEKGIAKEKRTKAIVGFTGKDDELRSWAKEDAKTVSVHKALEYSAKLGDSTASREIRDRVRVFKSDWLEGTRKVVEAVPSAADMLFKEHEYVNSMSGFLKARGYDVQQIRDGAVPDAVLNEGRAYAINEAMKATFNDSNKFSDAIANLRYTGDNGFLKALNIAGEGILPFRRTPANIVVRFAEGTIFNSARGVYNLCAKVQNGEMSAATAVDQISAGLSGTAMSLLGYFLASGALGFIKLRGSELEEDEERQGHQKYSLEFSVGGKEYSYKIDWVAPANLPLFVGANIYDSLNKQGIDGDMSLFTSIVYGTLNSFEPLLALSCLSGLNDLFQTARYADEDTVLWEVAADIATGYFTQGIPALLRQGAQAAMPNERQTFANSSDPLIRDLQTAAANIPAVGELFKTDRIDAWGNEEDKGGAFWQVFNAFINPGTLKAIDNSDLEAEINRLNKAQSESITPPEASKKISYTDKNGKYHDGYRLTEEEYTKLRQVQGQTAYEILQKVISSSDYKALTDAQKANVFSHVYSYASERARVNAISDYGGFSKAWMMNIRGKEADTIIRKVALGDISESVSALNKALDENWNTAEAAGNMETAWKAYSRLSSGAQAEIRKEAGESAAGKYIAARAAGVTNAEYVTVLKNVAGLKPQSGYKNVREIQQAQAVGKMSGLSNAEKESLVRGFVSDDQNIDDMKDLFHDKNRSFSVNDYLTAWAISEKESGKGRKDRIIAEYRKRFNLDEATAEELYKIFG